ncbi:NADP-dependent oxidoreductase [Actinomadura barringtoniae]|uniref:NADP-dependent oxidoreductase n=1 Tax=Actinomadura barringtoniae TaxID=1427535 RepID=A0A939PT68_9ACTN|nr:NADP-dependent oxidoreductase [Actinomadura barringtoniae]MBO2455853.1 NADP-dependent oxidoreductase [Actinomadura barringtoniae]
MKAVLADEHGSAEVLRVADLPVPQPSEGQIQVRVAAAALNPADLKMLAGPTPLHFPHVPGSDFAGTVSEIGPGVNRFSVGDEVFGYALPTPDAAGLVSDPPSVTTGTMAEYAVFEADTPALAFRPEALPAARAAALPTAGLTALPVIRALETSRRTDSPDRGKTVKVLVIGAAGGVGSVLVPLLAEAGAHVIATALLEDQEYVRRLGAREFIDYWAVDTIDETLRRHPDGVDAVVNLGLPGDSLTYAERAIRRRGILLNVTFPQPDPADFRADLTVETLLAWAGPGDLDALAEKAAEGVMPDTAGRVFALGEGAEAYDVLQNEHTRGKIIVVMPVGDGR